MYLKATNFCDTWQGGTAATDWQLMAQEYKQSLDAAQQELQLLRQSAADTQRQLADMQRQQQQAGGFETEQAIADAVAQKDKELHSRVSALEQQVDMLQAMKQQQVQAALAEQEQALAASCDAKHATVQVGWLSPPHTESNTSTQCNAC